ncbi:MAG: flagellar motor switch protein FliG [Pseudodesulfovibrio sp.]|uniref:Flagellar motor switch protein FliG n=1 Tax=Pseudodesulfovibrio aespoeensis (strain ATCC 700646 / DSM 10631 / Aspo-2) TaxID=643562 RepID=E6VRI4_PSEA9|nr:MULTISPECIES: flagellar motor switch protein FliG [Pseudodesulfovibrio]MBU4191253.1 flagellar motor switch protein FliG [Pseudomonadota bacterium]ADU63021.1 flagellar motor switch protein FliG [Pseudodesulfovibrio aespoeensis Aspo-2]MBU4244154.1 flagellar motor switch protein FliG [Pseudomonadota bacterium]MBU4377936.1 flagellar motor switch protein FliG [Pseudomonadota bacterium]MBU4475874.1 flagellar motor switch protein FliG [Pseudomonadota bacterium]
MADFTGPQKTAIVLLALGEKFTSDVFKRMERNEIAAVSKAMLYTDSIPREQVLQVLKEYNEALAYGAELLVGGAETVKRLLTKSLDSETAKYIMDSLDLDTGPTPFQELQNVSPRILAQILRNEHPQTLALILGHLHPDQAAELLQNLPAGVRAEVLMRLAKLEAVAEEMLMEVDKVLQSQLIAMGGKEGKKVGGVSAVAEILNAVDRNTEEEVLSEIEEESTQMAEDIRNLMFVFEDIKAVDDIAIRELLKEVSNEDLTVALKGASDDLKDKFFKNLSERASTMIKEDLEIMPPKKLSEVEAAQQNIVKTVRRLEDEGRIVINRGGSDVFV